MKGKTWFRMGIDVGMTVLLMLLMAFELVGRGAHEWIGVGMLVLFIVHHVLNRSWWKNIVKGKYTAYRTLQTALVILVFLSMAGSMISGIMLSREVFAFLQIRSSSFARTLHLVSAYWGFVAMSLHLGLHWSMAMGMAKRAAPKSSAARTWLLRCAAVLVAGYGIYAFVKRDLGTYMFLKSEFVFFDFEEPLVFFFFDYLAVMGLFVWIGYYLSKISKQMGKKKKDK